MNLTDLQHGILTPEQMIAVCVGYHLSKPVCCNDSYEEKDGVIVHENPRCADCCGPHFAPRGSPSYERMDCEH